MLSHTRRRHLQMLSMGAVGMMLPACAQFGGLNRITLAHTLDEMHPVHLGMERFKQELTRLSSNTMEIEIFPNGQLGTERELVELVQLGAVSMTKVSSLSLENFAEDMQVYSLPFIFDDSAHRWRVLESDIGSEILDGLSAILLKGLGYFDAGSRSFYMTDGPVNTPDDIKGKTVRILASKALVGTIEIFGGAAAPIAFGELYAALQQGVVDGAENNPPSLVNARHYEVAKYYSLNEHVSSPDVVVMSKATWDGLTPQQKEWTQESINIASAYQRELWDKATNEALITLEANGVIINRPDKEPFRQAVKEFRDSFNGTRLGDLSNRIEAMKIGAP